MTERPDDPQVDPSDDALSGAAASGSEAAPSAGEAAGRDAPGSDAPASDAPVSDAAAASAAAGEPASVTPDDDAPESAGDAEASAAPATAAGGEPASVTPQDDAPSADARTLSEEDAAAGEAPAPEESPAVAPTASTPPVTAPAPRRRSGGDATPGDAPVAVRATARYVRTSARKARLVCDHIRGKSVTEARAILAFTPRAAAKPWAKLLESAVANAEHNHELVGEDLRITAVFADEGPTLKRFQPRAMGRATRIRKRTSHLTIILSPKDVPAGTRRGARRKGGR